MSCSYRQRYRSKDVSLDDVDSTTVIEKDKVNTLKEDMSSELEGKLIHHEPSVALTKIRNNTSPGSNGYTVEIFLNYFRKISMYF